MADSDERGLDTTRLSTAADAAVVIERFKRKDPSLASPIPIAVGGSTISVTNPPAPPSPWAFLTRLTIAQELSDIVANPRGINQGPFNLCGPCAFFAIIAARHPKAFAVGATDLFDTGKGTFGALTVAPNLTLLSTNFPAIVANRLAHVDSTGQPAPLTTATSSAAWMLISALRNSTSSNFWPTWDGQPDSSWSGMTLPGEMETWFNNTGFFSQVLNRTNLLLTKGVDTATALTLGSGQDHALLVNANILTPAGFGTQIDRASFTAWPPWDSTVSPLVTNQLPNHWIMLTNHMTVDTTAQTVTCGLWSWGRTVTSAVIPLGGGAGSFNQDFFGAVSTQTSP